MLVKYHYMKTNLEEFGWFQCDWEDFKKFFLSRNDIRCLVLHRQDGKSFIWQNFEGTHHGRRIGGWQYIGPTRDWALA